jgi:hypothetical protein
MELKIKRKVEQEEIINIDFPYYYKQDLLLDETDVVIYGKIERDRYISITVESNGCHGNPVRFELEIKIRSAESLSCYMTDEYKGTEKEFLNAKESMLKAISEI